LNLLKGPPLCPRRRHSVIIRPGLRFIPTPFPSLSLLRSLNGRLLPVNPHRNVASATGRTRSACHAGCTGSRMTGASRSAGHVWTVHCSIAFRRPTALSPAMLSAGIACLGELGDFFPAALLVKCFQRHFSGSLECTLTLT
jgi:hypothetical protein